MQVKIARLLFLVMFVLTSSLSNISLIHAQAYRGLVIDETKFDVGLQKKGTVIKKSFTVLHDFQDENKQVKLYPRAVDFESDNLSGVPKFISPDKLSQSSSLAKWITFDQKVIELNKYGEKVTVSFTINVPQDADPGGKYAAVLLSDKEGESAVDYNDEKTKLGMTKELGPLVLLTIDGDIKTGISHEAFYTADIDSKPSWFFFNPPVQFVTVMKNRGNIHTAPRGAIYVYQGDNFQNSEAKFELNDNGGFTLPNSTRTYVLTWTESFIYDEKEKQPDGTMKTVTKFNWDRLSKLRIGKYNAKLMYLSEDEPGKMVTHEATVSFWVIPWPLILFCILLVSSIVLFFVYKRVKKKVVAKRAKGKTVTVKGD